MNKKILLKLFMFILTFFISLAACGEDAEAILKAVDEQGSGSNAPKDVEAVMILNIHKGKSVKTRELKAWSKNNTGKDDWRIMKFVSPADAKNIGLLILAENQMYLYLPEFRRIRRIASSNKKSSFQGSDFSYHDLSSLDFCENYTPESIKEDGETWLIDLKRKETSQKPYKKILLTVGKKNHMPLAMELYDNQGNIWKKMENKIKKVGKYNIIQHIRIENKKKGTFTTLELKDIQVDQGIDNSIFTQRFLKKQV